MIVEPLWYPPLLPAAPQANATPFGATIMLFKIQAKNIHSKLLVAFATLHTHSTKVYAKAAMPCITASEFIKVRSIELCRVVVGKMRQSWSYLRRTLMPALLAISRSSYEKQTQQRLALSDVPPTYWKEPSDAEFAKLLFDSVAKREQYLVEAAERAEYNAEAFIVLISTGSAIAWLTLIYRIPQLSLTAGTYIALPLYAISVLAISFVKLMRIVRIYAHKGEWERNSVGFLKGAVSFEQIRARDHQVWHNPPQLLVPAWIAYIGLGLGTVFAASSIVIWALAGTDPSTKAPSNANDPLLFLFTCLFSNYLNA